MGLIYKQTVTAIAIASYAIAIIASAIAFVAIHK
jgi:hypothetical protein